MRLRVLVAAASTPRLVTRDPIDVLENGVAGARWVVADAWPDMDEARSALLRALQARAGTPATPLRQVLVRLPRRLCGPRLHPSRSSVGGNGFDEVIRWLRGLSPDPERLIADPADPRRRNFPMTVRELADLGEANHLPLTPERLWDHALPRSGLGGARRLRRRSRSRRGRSRKLHEREVELGLRPPPRHTLWDGQTIDLSGPIVGRRMDVVVYDDLMPSPAPEAVAQEVGRVVAAGGGKASDVRVDGDRVTFTATIERPLDESPELPKRSDIGPNDPNPWGADPPAPTRALPRIANIGPVVINEFQPAWPAHDHASYDGAFLAWLAYEVDTETFDRQVCTGPIGPGGGILPANGHQHARINEYARHRRDELHRHLGLAGADDRTSQAARNHVRRLSHEDAIEQLRRAVPVNRDSDAARLFPREVQRARLTATIVALHYRAHLADRYTARQMEHAIQHTVDGTLWQSVVSCSVTVSIEPHGRAEVQLLFGLRDLGSQPKL